MIKIRLKPSCRVSAYFVTLLVGKNTSNMSKSTYFAGQPFCELSKILGEAAVYDGFYHNHALCSHS